MRGRAGVIWRPIQPGRFIEYFVMSLSLSSFRSDARVLFTASILLLSVLMAPAAQSAEVSGLYDAVTPVAGVGAAERNVAVRDAMGKVLVKVTGNRQVTSRKALAAELDNASRYLQQYRYQSLSAAQRSDQPQQQLLTSFDKNELDRLLRNLGLPVWSANRPTILIWLGDEQRAKRRLLTPDLDSSVRAAVDRVAAARGLPLMLPLMDLEDQGQLQVADLWGDFENNIRAASRRYAPDLILTGRLIETAARSWRGDWRLYSADSQSHWSSAAATREELVTDALQQAADNLANRFAPLREERSLSTVRLRVAGISALTDYAAVLELLSSQNSLERVVLVAVEPEAVVYDLHGQGGAAALEPGLEVGGLIEADPNAVFATDTSAPAVDLYYRMR